MKPTSYRAAAMSVATLLALSTMAASYRWMALGRATAEQSFEVYQECDRIARELIALRSGTRVASLELEPPDRILARVTVAAKNSGVDGSLIQSVDPEPPTRVGRSAYQQRVTRISLQNVTLLQVVQFIESLESISEGLTARDLQLTTRPRGDDGSERWDSRLVLTQWIYSPISES